IPALANHFLAASARSLGVPVKRLTAEAISALTRFEFPGNVRQLENFCHWLTVMAPGQIIERADLPPEIRAMTLEPPTPLVTGATESHVISGGASERPGAIASGRPGNR